ncbi:MAG: alpha/beta hydrolase [Pirellulaceae bacterium]
MPAETFRQLASRLAWRWLRLALAGYLVVLLLLLLLENMLLYPAPKYPQGDWEGAGVPHEDVYFDSADGTRLHGWYVEHPQPRAVVLYAHGNGEHVAYLGPYLKQLRDELRISIFAFDYRGYGRSEGSPLERGILEDAQAAQLWLAKRTGCQPNELVLMGRSLGGAVAVDLAASGGARGLVLQNTFTSLPDAAARLYPWVPVRWLMRNRYDSLAKIGRYNGPVLFSHGTADELVPYELGRRLYDAAPGPKEFFVIERGGHNQAEPRAYYEALDRFLDSLPAARR